MSSFARKSLEINNESDDECVFGSHVERESGTDDDFHDPQTRASSDFEKEDRKSDLTKNSEDKEESEVEEDDDDEEEEEEINEEVDVEIEKRSIHQMEIFKKVFAMGPNKGIQIKVSTVNKPKHAVFSNDRLHLTQTLKHHEGSVWCVQFAPCGNFLATAGQDGRVIIWQVLKNSAVILATGAVFDPTPLHIFEGHSGDVISIAWSKSNFLLSAGIDKAVRMWHVARPECLQVFRHPDMVTSVEFHPAHDRYFISGCFDRRLRLWDVIPEGVVKEWAQTPDIITSVCFSPDGSTIAGGLIKGQIYFYEYEGMKYKTQMNCKNHAGKHSTGTKVTGMYFNIKTSEANGDNTATITNADSKSNNNSRTATPTASKDRRGSFSGALSDNNTNNNRKHVSMQLLVTTNDSRIRLCDLDDYSVLCKYKGLKNNSMQIKASYSENYNHLICSSEDGVVFVWDATKRKRNKLFSKQTKSKESCEKFETSDTTATAAIFAPSATVLCVLRNAVDGNEINGSGNSGTNLNDITQEHVIDSELNDLCTRIVITADYDGYVHCYLRYN